jgi:hypothetical protein
MFLTQFRFLNMYYLTCNLIANKDYVKVDTIECEESSFI